MNTANRERYLGDILSTDCRIDNNILDRYNKGIGYANDILSILKEMYFGHYYFNMAMQFRNAKLVNGMLCSIESLYGITKSHVEQLEQVDRFLMRKLFNCVITTPTEAYFLETNCLPISFAIIARRIMFYWTILHKSDKELAKQFLEAQQISPSKNDWCLKVVEDMKAVNINLSESEIRSMKKSKFKRIVNINIRESARKYLIKLKNKHSKSDGLSEDYKMQKYLISSELSTEEKQLLFHLRTRTFECRAIYSNQYGEDLACSICGGVDDQQHLLLCSRTTTGVDIGGVQYCDIFGPLEKQVKVVKILRKVIQNRTIIKKNSSNLGSQVHL